MQTPGKRPPPHFGHEPLFDSLQRAAADAVTQRAYELFIQRGGEHGHDLDDWLAAKGELLLPAAAEVSQEGSTVVVRLQAPGFGLADLEWDIQDRRLAVAGRRERTLQGSDGERSYSETRTQYLLESVELPVEVKPGMASITLVNDVVEVRLPQRQPKARPATRAA